MSRSYYAAFLHCREAVVRQGAHFPGSGRAHQMVFDIVVRSDPLRGAQLRMLRNRRNVADYELLAPVTPLDALPAWMRATFVVGCDAGTVMRP